MRNIRITVEFDGSGFAGWQYQPNKPTVQHALQTAVRSVTGESPTVYGCSRTDAGVSAYNYVANFHTSSKLKPEQLRLALNSRLPPEVFVKAAHEVDADFHARFSARSKTYVYTVIRTISPLRRGQAWELLLPIRLTAMRSAARLLVGRHDFRSFCQSRARNGVCTISSIRINSKADTIRFRITGDRFLYKMVRRMVGAMVACGSGRLNTADITAALDGKPHPPYTTAPACGLTLEAVRY